MDKKVSKINAFTVGNTRLFLLYIKIATLIKITINLIKIYDSNKAPAGNTIILAVRAAKIE